MSLPIQRKCLSSCICSVSACPLLLFGGNCCCGVTAELQWIWRCAFFSEKFLLNCVKSIKRQIVIMGIDRQIEIMELVTVQALIHSEKTQMEIFVTLRK